MNYCTHCGNRVEKKIPEGDDRYRYVCVSCGKIHYQNPRTIVGCIPVINDKVLLCKRGIAPRKDMWTIPAGFLENDETLEEGALRETLEETRLEVRLQRLHIIYSIPVVSQVYILFIADLGKDHHGATRECTEIRLFDEAEIPWDNIAFSAVRFALERFFEDLRTGNRQPHLGSLSD